MSLFVLDTDILSLYWQGHPTVQQRVDCCRREELAITVISVEEQLTGWYTLIRQSRKLPELAHAYRRLAECVEYLSGWRILPYTEAAMARVQGFQTQRLNIGRMDLRIASIVLEHNATLVTRNLRDFQRIATLTVENWAA